MPGFALWDSESRPAILCRCGTILSSMLVAPAPARMPVIAKTRAKPSLSNDGAMSPSMEAASITPAAKPSTMSLSRLGMFLKNIPPTTPAIVDKPIERITIASIFMSIGRNPSAVRGSHHNMRGVFYHMRLPKAAKLRRFAGIRMTCRLNWRSKGGILRAKFICEPRR